MGFRSLQKGVQDHPESPFIKGVPEQGSSSGSKLSDKTETPELEASDQRIQAKHVNEEIAELVTSRTRTAPLQKKISVKGILSEQLKNKYSNLADIGTGILHDFEWRDAYIRNLDTIDAFGFQVTSRTRTAPLQKKISVKDILSEQLKNEFSDLAYIGTGNKILHDFEWRDAYIRNLDTIDAFGFQSLEPATQSRFLQAAIKSLYEGVSFLSVGYILMGAAGLRSCEEIDGFALRNPKMNKIAVGVDKLDLKVVYRPKGGNIQSVQIPEDEGGRRSASFICAALLRLATKDHKNMTRAWSHIKQQYINFYKENMAVDFPVPDLECLRGIREILQSIRVLRNTIGCFLLAYCDTVGQDQGVCRMAFELHMAYTGMHGYSLLLFCAAKLQTPLNIFFALLTHPATKEALETAQHLLITYEYPLSEEAKAKLNLAKTWRYARVFDSNKFAPLQTKNCMLLVSILAYVSAKCGMGGSGDVKNIQQIAQFARQNDEWLIDMAEKIAAFCLGKGWEDEDQISGTGYGASLRNQEDGGQSA